MKDDAQLIDESLRGDSAAFGQLISRYQDRLYNSLVYAVGSPDLASDALQDALVQAYLKLATFQRTSGFYTWLYRIAFNMAASHRRRQRPATSVDRVREELGEEPVDQGAAPSGRLEQQERADQVRDALARISEEHRAILILREVDGCAYEEIAEALDLPVGTIRSRLHRARMHLREQLKDVMQEDVK